MDTKIVLNKEELQRLREFIYKRGFRDEAVINEILDHFACKVEEQLSANPKLSLNEAMYNAHQSFGVLGFYVIQANLDKSLKHRYRALYWASLKTVILSIPLLVLYALFWLAIYRGYLWVWFNHRGSIFGPNLLVHLFWLLSLGSGIWVMLKFKAHKHYYGQMAKQATWWVGPMFIPVFVGEPTTDKKAYVMAYLLASFVVLSIITLFAQYRVLKAASVDYSEFKQIAE